MAIVSPPRLVGTETVANLFGISRWWLRERVKAGEPIVMNGYLGKVSNQHTWNMHTLIAALFPDDSSIENLVDRAVSEADPNIICLVTDCHDIEHLAGLCRHHLRKMLTSWRHAPGSSLVRLQLVAMCQWVVERNAHFVLPAGFDPFAPVCMNDGCDGPTNIHGGDSWHGPLCQPCTADFWDKPLDRPRPDFWVTRQKAST